MMVMRLLDQTSGRIMFDGDEIGAILPNSFARIPLRKSIQMVFQDPTDSLNPRFTDRKSTRLNSSHLVISYAVFCLKKKKTLPDPSRLSCTYHLSLGTRCATTAAGDAPAVGRRRRACCGPGA